MNGTMLRECPFCGMRPPKDLIDTLYPSGTGWKTLTLSDGESFRTYHRHDEGGLEGQCYQIWCNTTYGGCGAEMHGDSVEEVVEKWNTRATEPWSCEEEE